MYPKAPERQRKFYEDLKLSLLKVTTWESVFRVRLSSGWKTKMILGNYLFKANDLLSLTNLDK